MINNLKTEIYLPQREIWQPLSDYPFASTFVSRYAIIYTRGGYILFGGYNDNKHSATVARLGDVTFAWSDIGKLQEVQQHRKTLEDMHETLMKLYTEGVTVLFYNLFIWGT